MRREFLEALEEMNIKMLPGKAYALAFLRSYARELGLDEKAIVDQFQDESALTREEVAQTRSATRLQSPRQRRPWLAAAGAGGVGGWPSSAGGLIRTQHRSCAATSRESCLLSRVLLSPITTGEASSAGWSKSGR